MGCPYSTSNATRANIEAIRTGDTFAFQRSPHGPFDCIRTRIARTQRRINMFARITRARRISIRPIQHRHHTHMQTPKRAAISVSFFPHPTTGRRTVVTILHVFFCVGLCVSAVCRVRVCSGPTTVGDRIENVCSICGEHKIDSVRLPARMPPKISCNLQKPMSKQNARQCLRGHIPQTLARTRTHAIHPSETFNPSVRCPSCASCQGARPSHIHAHTQTRIHRRSIYVIHCCCFPTYAFYFVGLAIFVVVVC